VRQNHEPTCISFTVEIDKDTYHNVLATEEFVVNIPSFEREILEKVRVVGLPFPRGVNELEKAGLTAIPARALRPPRIAECKAHYECKVIWTKEWLHRLTVMGQVVAGSVDEDCIDKDGYAILEKFALRTIAAELLTTNLLPRTRSWKSIWCTKGLRHNISRNKICHWAL
jgi:flavin reductase (DIM6/NTAB) family NADH-FMN oxidoreductase RutF